MGRAVFSDRTFRILSTIVLYVIFLEGLSWLTSTGPGPCIVSPEQHGHASENNHQQACATFLHGLLILLGRADHFLEHHDKSIVAVFTAVLAISTIGLWRATNKLWRAGEHQMELIAASGAQQSNDMRASIAEAVRAASAMESVANAVNVSADAAKISTETMRERTALQMRSYIAVLVGGALYQEREKGLRFEARPIIVNTGHTPAHDLGFQATAKVLPVPIPDDFDFPIPEEKVGASMLGPHQTFVMKVVAKDFADDTQVPAVKYGQGMALCTWGLVTYRDVFGEQRKTRFSQILTWVPDDSSINCTYTKRHNDAD